jgi:hypothetical protein
METGTGTEACTLQTVSESKETEKGKGDSKSSESEMRSLLCGFCGFSFCRSVLSVNKGEGSAVQWEGGITFSNKILGTDGFCDEGPGQDDEG